MAKTYHIWLDDTELDCPIIVTVCAFCYDDLSFSDLIQSQMIVKENVNCQNPDCKEI